MKCIEWKGDKQVFNKRNDLKDFKDDMFALIDTTEEYSVSAAMESSVKVRSLKETIDFTVIQPTW